LLALGRINIASYITRERLKADEHVMVGVFSRDFTPVVIIIINLFLIPICGHWPTTGLIWVGVELGGVRAQLLITVLPLLSELC